MRILREPDIPSQAPPDDDPDRSCAACGRCLRYRGRRGKTLIFECENPACPVTLAEILDPGADPARRRGGGR